MVYSNKYETSHSSGYKTLTQRSTPKRSPGREPAVVPVREGARSFTREAKPIAKEETTDAMPEAVRQVRGKRSFYEVLGVERSADLAAVKKA